MPSYGYSSYGWGSWGRRLSHDAGHLYHSSASFARRLSHDVPLVAAPMTSREDCHECPDGAAHVSSDVCAVLSAESSAHGPADVAAYARAIA